MKENPMKVYRSLLLTLLVGTALGAAAIQALHAQVKPPVYVVVDISEVTDPVGWRTNTEGSMASAAALFQEFGGRYLARSEKITALDGTVPKRFVIIAFDSTDKAQGWYNSPVQKEVNAVRIKATKSRSFIVDGLIPRLNWRE
jgi:uncharacterized protein (DUF1330 family)